MIVSDELVSYLNRVDLEVSTGAVQVMCGTDIFNSIFSSVGEK
jgi:hypothetical protein